MYYTLNYPHDCEGWIVSLGETPGPRYDPTTGEEDFRELRRVKSYFTNWRPDRPWNPQPITICFEDLGRKRCKVDRLVHSPCGPILSENAINTLRPLLEREGHIKSLNVMNADDKFYFWWVPWVEDCVDFERSEKFPENTVKKYVFYPDKVKGLTAFRPHYSGMYNPAGQGEVFVNEEFKRAWLDADLTGIDFRPV